MPASHSRQGAGWQGRASAGWRAGHGVWGGRGTPHSHSRQGWRPACSLGNGTPFLGCSTAATAAHSAEGKAPVGLPCAENLPTEEAPLTWIGPHSCCCAAALLLPCRPAASGRSWWRGTMACSTRRHCWRCQHQTLQRRRASAGQQTRWEAGEGRQRSLEQAASANAHATWQLRGLKSWHRQLSFAGSIHATG